MRRGLVYAIPVVILLATACGQKKTQTDAKAGLKVTEATGTTTPYVAPKAVKAGKPVRLSSVPAHPIPARSNARLTGAATIVAAGNPSIPFPENSAGYIAPATQRVQQRYFAPDIPEIIAVKDASTRDHDPEDFLYFGKQQGLAVTWITSICEDKFGNIWFGTVGGGASRYDGHNITNFMSRSGKLKKKVNSILPDKNGDLWFGTTDGLYMYDGRSVVHFTVNEDSAKESIQRLAWDKNGLLWIVTVDNRLIRFDGKEFTYFTTLQGLAYDKVNYVFPDRNGNIWIGTYLGLSRFDGKSFANYTVREGLPGNFVDYIIDDRNGNLWIATGNGISRFDGKYFTNYSKKEGLADNWALCLQEDHEGNIWVGTPYGLSRFDGSSFSNFTTVEGLSNNFVSSMFLDRKGNFWIGTSDGLNKYSGKTFTHLTDKDGLPDNQAACIYQDKNGVFWIGTLLGGLSRFDGKTFTNYSTKEGLASSFVSGILRDKNGILWVGTLNGLSRFDGNSFSNYTVNEGLPDNLIKCMLQDEQGHLWLGTERGISIFDGNSFTNIAGKDGLTDHRVQTMVAGKKGDIWIGTNGDGLFRFTGNAITRYTDKNGLPDNIVNAIVEAHDGSLWIGTANGGAVYNGKTFTVFNENNGLSNPYIQNIVEDRSGNIWIGTRTGLNKLSPQNIRRIGSAPSDISADEVLFRVFTHDDGYLGIGALYGAMLEDTAGTLWIGTQDRLTCYHPAGYVADTAAPSMQLTGLSLFSDDIKWGYLASGLPGSRNTTRDTSFKLGNGILLKNFTFDSLAPWSGIPENLSLAYNNNYVTFHYSGITTRSPKNVRYRYRIDGIDDNWSALTSSTDAHYGNLPPGNFTFRVKAVNSEGYWSSELRYSFRVRPPWWQTWWFRSLAVLLALGAVASYIKWRERMLKQRQRVLEQTVAERTSQVVAEKKEAEIQKKRSDELLLNILPGEVADELKEKGAVKARHFDNVTVLFTDFVNFSQTSRQLNAEELIAELDTCFKAFDEITSRYNVEKIKTIGDAYLAISGLPIPDEDHAVNMVRAAQEILVFIHDRRKLLGNKTFDVRIGIHSGGVIAGIVGVRKFAYDIWGDTVNIAARMEQNSLPGRINISDSTYQLIRHHIACEYRGEIPAKNIGNVKMYFVS